MALDARDETLIALDKADKIGADGVREELLRKNLVSAQGADRLLGLVASLRDLGRPDDAPLTSGIIEVPGADISMRDLPQIVAAVRSLVPWATIEFDATLVRGMGYYTGPIFEVAHKDRNFSVAGAAATTRSWASGWAAMSPPADSPSVSNASSTWLLSPTPTMSALLCSTSRATIPRRCSNCARICSPAAAVQCRW